MITSQAGVFLLAGLALLWEAMAADTGYPAFDFTQAADRSGWEATHDVGPFQAVATGMRVTITGADPFITGPKRDYPAGQPLWLRVRQYSDAGGLCQVFYFTAGASEANSVRFNVPAAQWVENRVALPALGTGYRLRIDPPGTSGTATLAGLQTEARGTLPDWDFATLPDATDWQAWNQISALTPTTNGLQIAISGGDPYMGGPARNYPSGTALWLHVLLKSDQGGGGQLFYFTDGPTEENSVHFSVPAGQWHEAIVPMPALGPGYRLRLDPPGSGASCLLKRLWFEERVRLQPPVWPQPAAPQIAADAPVLQAGLLTLAQNPGQWGGCRLEVAGQRFACGNPEQLLGYLLNKQQRWVGSSQLFSNGVQVISSPGSLRVTGTGEDGDGAAWKFEQVLTATEPGVIQIEGSVQTDRDREVVYLPLIQLLAGVESFGTNKHQALFAGLEYLENEPSSSEADVIGPASKRQVPNNLKITLPMMAIQAEGRYLALIWEPDPRLSALFDSPDRQFNSGGHLLGLQLPGSDGLNREEGSLLPYKGLQLAANQPFHWRATLLAGTGESVVPAVQQYVRLRGLPAVPDSGYTAESYFRLAAHGWLDSGIRDGDRYRHALWPGFNSQPAADAAMWMRWLSGGVNDPALSNRLETAATGAIAQVSPAAYNATGIGHVRYPVEALVFGAVAENASAALQGGRNLLSGFQPDGHIYYVPPASGTDYSKTHWSKEANGLTANSVVAVLEAAVFSGDRSLTTEALRLLRAMDTFKHTVPRGAQTWEVPLHTPDILASAYLVRAYVLGYELTGEGYLLEQARYWAWTGVPFVYLVPPTPQPVGVYSTIPVLGATAWVAPVWIGLPVQWCGLVYGDALTRLARYDDSGPWRQLADGIAAAGIQHSWPTDDAERQGLLPDSYDLAGQQRGGPPINPATVLACAAVLHGGPTVYDFRSLPRHGLVLHAAGAVTGIKESTGGVQFTVHPWSAKPSWLLINGLRSAPQVRFDGRNVPLSAPHAFQSGSGRLILQLQKETTIELIYPAVAALKIAPSAVEGAWDVHWPRAASNWVLQAAESLSGTPAWADVAGPIASNAVEFTQTLSARDPSKWFRLRSSP